MALCRPMRPRFLGPNVYPEAPDGGWGWVVALAFFLVEVFTYGTIKSFGIFLQDLMEEFGETNSRVSWVVSISVFVMTFNGPLSSVLTNRFGFQLVVMTGGLLISSGTIATSFAGSINQMYLTYGLIAGFGYCLTFLPTVTILSHYFTRRRSLVTAVASTGESLSMIALAPAFSALRDRIGWRHTMAVVGALQGIIIISGALLRPIVIKPKENNAEETDALSPTEVESQNTPESTEDSTANKSLLEPNASDGNFTSEPFGDSVSNSDVQVLKIPDSSSPEERTSLQREEQLAPQQESVAFSGSEQEINPKDAKKQVRKLEDQTSVNGKPSQRTSKLLDFSILRECSFICYSLFGLFATLGFFAPQLYIIELSVSRGVKRESAAYMLSTMAVAEIFGRFSIGWVLTRKLFIKRKLLVILACVITMTVDLVGFTLVTEFYGLAVCCAVYGFFMGTLACTHIPLLAEDDVVGLERMSSAAGVYVFIHSFAGLAGPPLGGLLVDLTKNCGSAFYSCAAGMAVSAVFLGLVRPAKRGLFCRKGSSEQREEDQQGRRDPVEINSLDKVNERKDNAENCLDAAVTTDHNHVASTRDVQGLQSFCLT